MSGQLVVVSVMLLMDVGFQLKRAGRLKKGKYKMKKFFLGTSALAVLAACGGSGSGPYATNVAGFLELADRGEALAVLEEDLLPTTLAQTPTGSAEFSGTGLLSDVILEGDEQTGATFVAIGEANIEVEFQTQQVSGAVSNFYEVDTEQFNIFFEDDSDDDIDLSTVRTAEISGTLTFNPEEGSVSGSVTRQNGDVADYSLINQEVQFYGPNAEVVEVSSVGTSAVNDDASSFAGLFVFAGQ